MKWINSTAQVEIARIRVDREGRQRQAGRDDQGWIKDTSDLELSIKRRGQINPIIISPLSGDPQFDWELKAGERRITACHRLGHSKVLARKVSDLSQTEAEIIELEENIKRQDLDWQDMVRGVARIHFLFLELDSDWTMGGTAEECGLNISTVSMYISVFNEMEEERVRNAGSVREAYNMLKRRSQRQAGAALQELLDAPAVTEPALPLMTEAEEAEVKARTELGQPIPPHIQQKITAAEQGRAQATRPKLELVVSDSILHTEFETWSRNYSGQKFNLLHCDFPYGVNLFSGPQGRGAELGEAGRVGYNDAPDIYWQLIDSFCEAMPRFISVSGHLMFWLSADLQIIAQTVARFAEKAPQLRFHKFPLIWMKSDNAGIASDPRHGPRHVYEACLLGSWGSRQIARVKGDAYSAPTDKRLHPSTKPEPMLRHFMEMLVDETTVMLDPTCGSGAALRAAESLGAKHVLGLERDLQFVEPARLALHQARMKRAAESASALALGAMV